MKTVALELKEANAFTAERHRRHLPTSRNKWRFGLVFCEKAAQIDYSLHNILA